MSDELNLEDVDKEFLEAYKKYFKFEFYGTNEEVISLLKKLFEAATFDGQNYFFDYEEIGKKINNVEFTIFVLWYMIENNLLEYGTSPRYSWCGYQDFGFSESCNNYDYYGFVITDYFRKHSVDFINDLLELEVDNVE